MKFCDQLKEMAVEAQWAYEDGATLEELAERFPKVPIGTLRALIGKRRRTRKKKHRPGVKPHRELMEAREELLRFCIQRNDESPISFGLAKVPEIAGILQVNSLTVKNWSRRGKLPPVIELTSRTHYINCRTLETQLREAG